MNGPFFFGAADRFKHVLNLIVKKPKVLILRTRTVLAMDATALHALEEVYDTTKRDGSVLVLAGIHAQPLIAMDKAGFLDKVGVENVFENLSDALKRARAIVGAPRPYRRGNSAVQKSIGTNRQQKNKEGPYVPREDSMLPRDSVWRMIH